MFKPFLGLVVLIGSFSLLSAQSIVRVTDGLGDPTIAHVLMTEEVARALVRDPRVDFVIPNSLIPLAQDPG